MNICKCGHEQSAHREGAKECLVPLKLCYCEKFEAAECYLDDYSEECD